LGDTLSKIASEKSYVIRPNTPCIVANQSSDAGKIIELRALEISTPLVHLNQEFSAQINEDESFDFKYNGKNLSESFFNLAKPNLQGDHQYLNASLAIATILAIKDFKAANFNISKDQINQGLEKVKWPSRLEKINNFNKLLTHQESEVFIDGAHNIAGFEALSKWLKEKIIKDYENNSPKRNFLIVGFSKNKAKKEFFSEFQDIVDFICAVKVEGEASPEKKEVILDKIKESGFENANCQNNLADSIEFLTNLDQENPCRIVICGSLYLAR
jgi:dihydrofolate synthase/folylpolyglutamate synthase